MHVRKARWLRIALLAGWILFIWAHSLVPADASTEESDLFARTIAPLLSSIGIHDWDTVTFIVRKTAHFLEYCMLGILGTFALLPEWRSDDMGTRLVLAIAFLVPSVDETIQRFVDGRSAQLSDVLLDIFGVACGLLLAHRVRKR